MECALCHDPPPRVEGLALFKMREKNQKRNWAGEGRSVPLKKPAPASGLLERERYYGLDE
jgi:hypothetical protein